jgi:hypothetical protein
MPRPQVVVDRQKLADMDDARDYDAASSNNFLNAELGRLRAASEAGALVRIEDEAGEFILGSVAELSAWARGRFPHAKLLS